jgi:hypothetical protein
VQTFYAASHVDQARHPDGLVLTRLRQKALDGEEGIALIEYGAGITDDDGRDLLPAVIPAALAVDMDVVKRANPGCPERVSEQFLLDQARTMDPASFWAEHGGQGDWPDLDATAGGVVDTDKWAALQVPPSRLVGPIKLSFDVSPDRQWGSVGIVGLRADGFFQFELAEHAQGVGWIVPLIARIVAEHEVVGIVCDAAQATLAEQVRVAAGMACEMVDRGGLALACAGFIDLVENAELRHLGDALLLDAIRGAQIGRAGGDGWVFSRRSSRVDISPLYACVLALHVAQPLKDVDDSLWDSWVNPAPTSSTVPVGGLASTGWVRQ